MSIDIREYVKEYEAAHSQPTREIPVDPSKRWFKKDALTEFVDRCKYELYNTGERYALLQSDCLEACKQRH